MDTTEEVTAFLDSVAPERRHREAAQLDRMFRQVTGWRPRLWRSGILGYGSYDYTYASGRSGTHLATGFSPRKAKLSVYIMPGYTDFGHILADLGKHSIGKSCLYINKLEDVDMDVLGRLVRAGLDDLATRWPVHPT
ncbi:DUF1801 domain-containing protein [Roseobacter sp. YSTF-M11]|uniref:DUF1801 domain-containing protein n=1 Tax=Roseobacter insulae TaxID=2859783 RepID=A0A9X1FY75_9RHOB|nr:DUF1801 domain-containing protein [Roseobacter insulae]MBW4709803.1 DUF1801 domain-containing protein [Roseobacter insulae]